MRATSCASSAAHGLFLEKVSSSGLLELKTHMLKLRQVKLPLVSRT